MRRSPKHIVTYFHELFNEPINMQTFEDRLLLQKRVYFLQEFGVPFGYSFGWYIRGPYSSELADDGFENQNLSKSSNKNMEKYSKILPKPESDDKEGLKKAEKFFERIKESGISEDRLLELTSSLHFLINEWFENDYSAAAKKLRKRKPKFSAKEIEEAQKILEKFF